MDNTKQTADDNIASDDIDGVKFQRMKLTMGDDGVNEGDVSSSNPIPVYIVGQESGGSSGFGVPAALTIASGEITVSGTNKFRAHVLDTEGAVETDDLVTINGGSVGDLLKLQCANGTRTVVCKKGTPLKLQADFTLNNIYDRLLLECVSAGVWVEISRANNS
jgi:hypothetical protein